MPTLTKAAAVLVALTMLAAGVVLPSEASAQAAAQPCSGTICDLYYKSTGGPPASAQNGAATPVSAPAGTQLPPGATPMTVPSMPSSGGIMNFFKGGSSQDQAAQPTAAGTPGEAQQSSFGGLFHLGGGGLVDRSSEPCTGTICDLYHGTSGGGTTTASATAPASSNGSAPALTRSSAYIPPREAAARVPVDPALVQAAAQRRKMAEAAREARARCHNPSDPWHCMR